MNAIIKRLKSKTYWAALVGALLVVIEQNSGVFSKFLPDDWRTWAVLMWPVIMLALRELTTTALSEK